MVMGTFGFSVAKEMIPRVPMERSTIYGNSAQSIRNGLGWAVIILRGKVAFMGRKELPTLPTSQALAITQHPGKIVGGISGSSPDGASLISERVVLRH